MDAIPFHIGVATNDLEGSMRELGTALGLTWTEPSCEGRVFENVDGVPQPQPRNCSAREGAIDVQLMIGQPGSIWEVHGPRLHHLGYWTDDLRGDVARLAHEGWRLEVTIPDADGQPSVFAYLVRDDGFRLELVEDARRESYRERRQARPWQDERPLEDGRSADG
jgi:hypothetical protein